MSYKQIHETFWTDPDVKRYEPMQRYLYSYFITGPHAHYSGLYYLPIVYIQNETGLSIKDINGGISFLSERGHIFYDASREVIFVKSEMFYQLDNKKDGKIILNEKHVKGLIKHFDTLHKSPLISKFLETYNYLGIEYTPIYTPMDTRINRGIDRVSRVRASVPVPVLVPVDVQEGGAGETTEAGNKGFVFALPEDISPEAWRAFVDMRVQIKKPLTEYAKHLIILDLQKLEGDKNEILAQSVKNNWQGVFELKAQGGFNGNGNNGHGRGGPGQFGPQGQSKYPVDVFEDGT